MSIQNLIDSSKRFLVLTLATGLLAGTASAVSRTSSGYMEELARHADRNRGVVVASGGPLLSLRAVPGGAVLRIATSNYAHLFEVSFPQMPEGLIVGREVNFVGLLQGTQASPEAYGGKVIRISGLALKPVGSPMLSSGDQPAVADAWLKGDLDLSAGAQAPVMAAPPVPTSPTSPVPAPAAVAASDPPAPAIKPTKAVRKLVEAYGNLSEAEQADFLRRINGAR